MLIHSISIVARAQDPLFRRQCIFLINGLLVLVRIFSLLDLTPVVEYVLLAVGLLRDVDWLAYMVLDAETTVIRHRRVQNVNLLGLVHSILRATRASHHWRATIETTTVLSGTLAI